MKIMKLKSTLRIAAATFGLMAAVMVPAMAVQFAQFTQLGTNPNPWTFTNSGATSTFTANIPVSFSFNVPNGTGSTTTIPATMSFNSVVTNTAFNTFGLDFQPLALTTMTITANTPIGGLSNLLTLTGNGVLFGPNNAFTAFYQGDNTIAGQSVTYTSDFLTFGGSEQFSFSYNLKTPTTPLVIKSSNFYLKSFQAGGGGNFSSQSATFGVPEPSTNVAFLFGGLALLGLIAYGRKTRAGSMAS